MTTKLCERPFPSSFWCWICRVALSIERRPSWRNTCPGRFDCLITDVSMPGRSGLELQERLRDLGSSIPVIIVTADTNPATRSRAMRGGAYAYLTKPVKDERTLSAPAVRAEPYRSLARRRSRGPAVR